MKIVIAGGSGQLGQLLARVLGAKDHNIVVLSRSGPVAAGRAVSWDGKTLGSWTKEIDGCDAVINLAGRSVNCRYTADNLTEMRSSRLLSTELVGRAIGEAHHPPPVWLQMSTATLYAHRFDAANDEATGQIGGSESQIPTRWRRSVELALDWERAQATASAPLTRKVALRTAMVMGPERGGVFDALLQLARWGLGGPCAGGTQQVSWIHARDFARSVEFLLTRSDIYGPVNLAAPSPLPQRELMRILRTEAGVKVALPASRWMLEVGAFFMRTETELLLKSRYVVPGKLLSKGFRFELPTWPAAAKELVRAQREHLAV